MCELEIPFTFSLEVKNEVNCEKMDIDEVTRVIVLPITACDDKDDGSLSRCDSSDAATLATRANLSAMANAQIANVTPAVDVPLTVCGVTDAVNTLMGDGCGYVLGTLLPIKVIGRGGGGEVVLCKDIATNGLVAIKKVNLFAASVKGDDVMSGEMEGVMMRSLDSDHVAEVYGTIVHNSVALIFQRYFPLGTAWDCLMEWKKLSGCVGYSEEMMRVFSYRLFTHLAYIHSRFIIMRDVKPENILMVDYVDPRLTDFGLSFEVTPEKSTCHTPCGSRYYMAPEVTSGAYSFASDVYSAAVTSLTMLTGEVQSAEDQLQMLSRMGNISPECMDLMKNLTGDEKVRMTAMEALSHPWFAGLTPDTWMDMSDDITVMINRSKMPTSSLVGDAQNVEVINEKEAHEIIREKRAIQAYIDYLDSYPDYLVDSYILQTSFMNLYPNNVAVILADAVANGYKNPVVGKQ